MGSWLEIAKRTVAHSEHGPLEAEYALFDQGDIELAASELGTVHETGYRGTAASARARLRYMGVTDELVMAAAESARIFGSEYARGSLGRLVPYFGATELFEGGTYDATRRAYAGRWLDLAALANDLEVPGASSALQLLHLAALVDDTPDDAVVILHTAELQERQRPGARTHRRVDFEAVTRTVPALARLADAVSRGSAGAGARSGSAPSPSRDDLAEIFRERQGWCTRGGAPTRLTRLVEAASAVRARPKRGPLADPELWALECRMDEGDASDVPERLDALERTRGRTPATTYLRARASLMLGREEAQAIAARVSALALSMSNFAELELLAAQAWLAAGDTRRAAPYARDLSENSSLDVDLKARAGEVLRALGRAASIASAPSTPEHAAEASADEIPLVVVEAPPASGVAPADDERVPDTKLEADAARDFEVHPTLRTPLPEPPSPAPPASHPRPAESLRGSAPMPAQSSPPSSSAPPTQRGSFTAISTRAPHSSSGPRRASGSPPQHAVRDPSPTPLRLPSAPPSHQVRSGGAGLIEAFAPRRSDARAEGEQPAPPQPSRDPEQPSPYMRGASLPPYRRYDGGQVEAATALVDLSHSESAEYLSLPRSAAEVTPDPDVLPHSVPEARALFTHLSRELGREYRVERGVELRTDARAIEEMQAHLFDCYYGRSVRAYEDWLDVRRHSAFLSEILARTLGAEWVDITPGEFAYWAMAIPHGARIWPFARVLRYVAMGPKERDLVSYYLELKSLALGG